MQHQLSSQTGEYLLSGRRLFVLFELLEIRRTSVGSHVFENVLNSSFVILHKVLSNCLQLILPEIFNLIFSNTLLISLEFGCKRE